ncbi:hypothetical protein JHK82_034816 [Glycine max]|nr:hypothetical protein JHK82_034816 [Glycine max]
MKGQMKSLEWGCRGTGWVGGSERMEWKGLRKREEGLNRGLEHFCTKHKAPKRKGNILVGVRHGGAGREVPHLNNLKIIEGGKSILRWSANPSKDARGAYPSKDATLANLEGPTKIVAHREWMDVKRKPRRGNMNQKVATIGDLVNHNNKRKEGTKFSVFNQNYLIMLEGIKVVQNHSNRLLGVNEVTSSNVTSTSEKRELKKNENRCVQLDATTHGKLNNIGDGKTGYPTYCGQAR